MIFIKKLPDHFDLHAAGRVAWLWACHAILISYHHIVILIVSFVFFFAVCFLKRSRETRSLSPFIGQVAIMLWKFRSENRRYNVEIENFIWSLSFCKNKFYDEIFGLSRCLYRW
jgi:hypothetical protein